jgi:hypothetical protein
MASKNSFSTVSQQLINYNNNILNLISQLNSLMVSNDSSVQVDITDQNNILTTYDVPSWGYLQKEIQRMNNNINTLFSINENGALIQTSDNIWKKLVLVDLNKEPNQIQGLSQISNFESQRNHFFDGLLNPNLRINLDLTNKIEDNVRQILVRRYIIEFERNSDGSLTNNGQTALDSFNTTLRNRTDITIDDFLNWHQTTPGVLNSNEPYYDQDRFDVEPNQLLYDGQFSVLSIEEDSLNRKLWYNLNTLNYRVIATNETRQLSEGSQIIINREKTSTIYEVLEVSTSSSNPKIRLRRIQGNETIPVGEGTIKIYSPTISNKNVKITIGYAERNVIFLKSINTENHLVSKNWSPGVAYYTNDLTLRSSNSDNGKTMDEYYVEKVSDYGMAIKDLVETKTPISLGSIPNVPVLLSDNFKVVQINKHLTDNQDKKEIIDRYSKLKEIKSEINQLNESISSKKTEVRLSKFKSKSQSKTFDNELKELTSKKESSTRLLKTVTDEIITLNNSPNTNRKVTAKYRVRGFWDIPEPRLVRGSRPQEVVQFKIQYRYVSLDGNESQIETFKLKNTDGTDSENAVFSNWNTLMSDSRKRVYDSEEDVWRWGIENVSDADTPNINQLDIAIQKNERVEVRVKSLSEVGWPESPIESEWSEIFSIDFPEDSSSIAGEDDFILEEANREDTIVQVKSELGNIDEHLSDEIIIGDENYFHGADKIMAMIPDSNGNQQSLLTYLRYLTDKVTSLEEQINRTRGILQVYVYRDDEAFLVKNDTELQFNVECEDYLDTYDEDSSITGRVYRNSVYTIKDFYVRIINASNSSPLGLISSKNYSSDGTIYTSSSPQTFWVNDRDEILFNTSTGRTNTQLNNQFLWNVNFDSGNSNNTISKLSENIGNNFTEDNSNSLTSILSSTEYNLGFNESTILEFVGNNNSLLDTKKWIDVSPNVKSANKLLTTIHPSIQNLEDLVETNSQKVKTFQAGDELIVPINIYFKMNAFDKNDGSGKDYDYIDLNNVSTTTRHVKKVKFLLENEVENKPFIFRVKFTINRNKVVVQKLGKNNKLSNVSKFKYRAFNSSLIGFNPLND